MRPGGDGDQPQDRQRRDALAAAALADDRQRLAGHDVKRHAVDRAHDAVAGEEPGPQIVDLEQRLVATAAAGGGSAATLATGSAALAIAAHMPPRQARVERVAQPVAEQVDRQHRHRQA